MSKDLKYGLDVIIRQYFDIFIDTYVYVCECVCVSARERAWEMERATKVFFKGLSLLIFKKIHTLIIVDME